MSSGASSSIQSDLLVSVIVNDIECQAVEVARGLQKLGLSLELKMRQILERVRCDEPRRRIRGVNIRKTWVGMMSHDKTKGIAALISP